MTATSPIPAQRLLDERTRHRLVNFGLLVAEGFVVHGCSMWDVRLVDEARQGVRRFRRAGTSLQDR